MPNHPAPSAEPPGREAWLQAVARTLKGAPIESLSTRTAEGFEIEPLYDRGGLAGPVRTEAGWDVRAHINAADPAEANALAHEALGGGATSLLLRLGGGIASAEDMARALDGVVLEAAPAALDAGFLGSLAAGWLAEAVKGSPTARVAFHLDPLSAFAEAGESPGPIRAHVVRAAEMAGGLAATCPAASLFLASGRVAHEAGGSAALELGMMAAAAVAYARALAGAGLPVEAAFARIALGLAVDGDLLVSIAKPRAARRIWARIALACGAEAPARIEVRSSQRMLTAADPWTNLLRLTLAGFAGAVGGADALVLGAFTDALGRPAQRARRLARNTQLILMQEARLGLVADPAAGAWAIEAVTDQLARLGWSAFRAIEREGGLAAALTSGLVADQVAEVRSALMLEIAEGRRPVLGITDYPDPEPHPIEVESVADGGHPDAALPGPDSRCPPLAPMRLSAMAEAVALDLAP